MRRWIFMGCLLAACGGDAFDQAETVSGAGAGGDGSAGRSGSVSGSGGQGGSQAGRAGEGGAAGGLAGGPAQGGGPAGGGSGGSSPAGAGGAAGEGAAGGPGGDGGGSSSGSSSGAAGEPGGQAGTSASGSSGAAGDAAGAGGLAGQGGAGGELAGDGGAAGAAGEAAGVGSQGGEAGLGGAAGLAGEGGQGGSSSGSGGAGGAGGEAGQAGAAGAGGSCDGELLEVELVDKNPGSSGKCGDELVTWGWGLSAKPGSWTPTLGPEGLAAAPGWAQGSGPGHYTCQPPQMTCGACPGPKLTGCQLKQSCVFELPWANPAFLGKLELGLTLDFAESVTGTATVKLDASKNGQPPVGGCTFLFAVKGKVP